MKKMDASPCFWWYWRWWFWGIPTDPSVYIAWLIAWLIIFLIFVVIGIIAWHYRHRWWKKRIEKRNAAIARHATMRDQAMAERAARRQAVLEGRLPPKPRKPFKPIKPPKPAREMTDVSTRKPTPDKNDVQFCRHCGARAAKNAVYCEQCGKKL